MENSQMPHLKSTDFDYNDAQTIKLKYVHQSWTLLRQPICAAVRGGRYKGGFWCCLNPSSKVAWFRWLGTASLKTRSVEVRHREHFLLIQVSTRLKHRATITTPRWDLTERCQDSPKQGHEHILLSINYSSVYSQPTHTRKLWDWDKWEYG